MKYGLLLSTILLFSACSSSSNYTCICTDKGNNNKEVGNFIINADRKESASFECQQKNMKFSAGELFKDVHCELKIEEEK